MSSPTMGAWECVHGVDGRDFCDDCYSSVGEWRLVDHDPEWVPAMLRFNAAGDTKPGFECVHQLENGNGPCGGNVFEVEQEVAPHTCVVRGSDERGT